MTARLDPAAHDWMRDAGAARIFAVLGEARFVGGAVRNALMDLAVGDIDIATPLEPREVLRRLEGAGIAVVPTGLDHGTVTAIIDGVPYEVTSLRRDVETDGRRAVVAFTTDWREDAARRDFTVNALYADASGALFDYFGGLDDLRARRLRFVGDADTRIREDYLRILRLFRFHAWYGADMPDADALAAAARNRQGLTRLSAERVQKEMLKLLAAPDPVPSLRLMQDSGILEIVLPGADNLARLSGLVALDVPDAADPILRLAALVPSGAANAARIAQALKLSKIDARRLEALAGTAPLSPAIAVPEMHRALYRSGAHLFIDRLLLAWAQQPAGDWATLLQRAREWLRPHFPLSGHDAIAAGLSPGPQMGQALAALEEAWVASDFTLDRAQLLARLAAFAG